jgi:hypothetical protein
MTKEFVVTMKVALDGGEEHSVKDRWWQLKHILEFCRAWRNPSGQARFVQGLIARAHVKQETTYFIQQNLGLVGIVGNDLFWWTGKRHEHGKDFLRQSTVGEQDRNHRIKAFQVGFFQTELL